MINLMTTKRPSIVTIILLILGIIFIGFLLIAGIAAIQSVCIYTSYNNGQSAPQKPYVMLPFKDEMGHDLNLTNNVSARDPTYAEVLEFMKEDSSDVGVLNWSDGKNFSTLGNSTVQLHDNAEKKGIKAGVAKMTLNTISNGVQELWVCNVFKTSDEGIVYVSTFDPDSGTGMDCVFLLEPMFGMNKIYVIPQEKAEGMSYKELKTSMGHEGMNEMVERTNFYW